MSLPVLIRSKSVIVSAILFFSAAGWWILGVWGNSELVLQKLGLSENVTRLLADPRMQQTLFVVAMVVVFVALGVQINRVLEQIPEPNVPKSEPVFTEGIDHFSLSVGTNRVLLTIAQLEVNKHPFPVANIPAAIYAEGGKPFVDVVIRKQKMAPPVSLIHNELRNRPTSWDMNSDERSIEVVNEKRKPVFQLYFTAPSEMIICGRFANDRSLTIATERTTVIGPDEPEAYPLKRIFRYPSKKHNGQRLSGFRATLYGLYFRWLDRKGLPDHSPRKTRP